MYLFVFTLQINEVCGSQMNYSNISRSQSQTAKLMHSILILHWMPFLES